MMLKKLSILLIIIGITTNLNAQIKTPQPSPLSKIEQVVGLTNVSLEYSRPSMKGRTIFGDLVPYGKLWRTGANANTKITFGDNVIIDSQKIVKGTYAIYTIPNKTTWDIIFYSDANNWGTPKKWEETKIVAKTTVQVVPMDMKVETFTITFDELTSGSAVLGMLWENTYVGVKFEVPTDAIASKSIEVIMNGPTDNDYYQAASYYHAEGKNLKQALEWMKLATEGDNPEFWYLRRMSLIQADLGDKEGAIKTAKQSLEGAKKAGNADYVKMNTESIKKWSN
jgi:hypothetical protein